MRKFITILFLASTLIMCGPSKKELAKIHIEQTEAYDIAEKQMDIWMDIYKKGIAIKDCEEAADYWFSILNCRYENRDEDILSGIWKINYAIRKTNKDAGYTIGIKEDINFQAVKELYNDSESKFYHNCKWAKNQLQSIYIDLRVLAVKLHGELYMEIGDYKLAQIGVKIR